MYRGAASLALFALFGLGALAISPLMLALRRPERTIPVIRFLWRPLLLLFDLTGLIRVEARGLGGIHSSVIVANHPSLIDVVILVALIPRTLYVAKHALRVNPFLAAVVRATSLPDDGRLPAAAAPYLERGWNVLVFPEGTRSPASGLHPFRRGAAWTALESRAPVVALALRFSRRILAKDSPPWLMHEKRVMISVDRLGTLAPPPDAAPSRRAAIALTASIGGLYRGQFF